MTYRMGDDTVKVEVLKGGRFLSLKIKVLQTEWIPPCVSGFGKPKRKAKTYYEEHTFLIERKRFVSVAKKLERFKEIMIG